MYRALVAATVVATVLLAVPAHAVTGTPFGPPCGATLTYADPAGLFAGPSPAAGEMHGGPVVVTGAEEVTLTCTIVVDGYYAGVVAWIRTSGPGVAVLPPTLVAINYDYHDTYFVCTDVDVDGTHFAYDAVTGTYVTDPAAATCPLMTWVPGVREVGDAVCDLAPQACELPVARP